MNLEPAQTSKELVCMVITEPIFFGFHFVVWVDIVRKV